MPYILVRGNLAAYGQRYPWRVLVSGLKAADIEQLNRFASGGYCDDSTIVYMQHPCVILTALEVLGMFNDFLNVLALSTLKFELAITALF